MFDSWHAGAVAGGMTVPAQPRIAAAVKHLHGRAVPSRALASPSRGAGRPVILGGAANSGHSRRTPSASGCGRAAPGARTYRFGLNLSAAPPPSRRRDCARVEASERRFLDDQRGPEHRSCYTGPGSTGLVVGSVDHVRKRSSVVRMRAPAKSCRAPLWTGSRLPVADPRGPVSDSLSLIDGARTVGASRVVTRGLLELAYDVCSQSASIT